MTFDEIAEFLAANKDSEEFGKLSALFPKPEINADAVKEFIESPEGEKLIKSGTVKSVESHIRAILDRQAEKRAGEVENEKRARMTVEEQLAELRKALEERDKATARAEWKSKAYQLAASRGVPTEFVDSYGGDTEAIESYLDMIKKREDSIRAEVEKKAMANGFKPGAGGKPASGQVDYKAMSSEERLARAMAEAEKRMGGSGGN